MPSYVAPVAIKCRWSDRSDEFIQWDGTKETSSAVVMVDRDVEKGAVLLLGGLDDVDDANVPQNNGLAREVRGFRKVPNLRNTEFVRVCYL